MCFDSEQLYVIVSVSMLLATPKLDAKFNRFRRSLFHPVTAVIIFLTVVGEPKYDVNFVLCLDRITSYFLSPSGYRCALFS